MHTMTVQRPENGLLYSSGILTAYEESGLQYSLMPHQHQAAVGTAGNHVAYLADGHQQQQPPPHLHRHLAGNENGTHATITVNPMAIASEMPAMGMADETCRERKKTFYILICLIVVGISVMVITVITAIVIFFKCESSAPLFFPSLQTRVPRFRHEFQLRPHVSPVLCVCCTRPAAK